MQCQCVRNVSFREHCFVSDMQNLTRLHGCYREQQRARRESHFNSWSRTQQGLVSYVPVALFTLTAMLLQLREASAKDGKEGGTAHIHTLDLQHTPTHKPADVKAKHAEKANGCRQDWIHGGAHEAYMCSPLHQHTSIFLSCAIVLPEPTVGGSTKNLKRPLWVTENITRTCSHGQDELTTVQNSKTKLHKYKYYTLPIPMSCITTYESRAISLSQDIIKCLLEV